MNAPRSLPVILVVEDDLGIATLETEQLEDLGFQVLRAGTGRAALELLSRQSPSLMLLDYSLPDMNAIDLLDHLQARGQVPPPFLVATGAGDEHVAVDLMQRGAHNYLVKDHEFLNLLPKAVERAQRDIELARRLAEAEDKLRLAARVLECTTEAVMVTDVEHRIVEVNPAFEQITGYARADLLGKLPTILNSGHASDGEQTQRILSALKEQGRWQGEVTLRRHNGELFTAWFNISRIEGEAAAPPHIVTLFSDISSVKASAEHLAYLAHHDPLTGLPNRLLFGARLAQSLERARRRDTGLGVLFLDLDHFKEVNDRLGHATGDDLLRLLAGRMGDVLRDEDTLARLGGDEFVIIVEDADCEDDLHRVVQQLLALFPHPVQTPEGVVPVSASIGGALFPEDATSAEQLMAGADAAMYLAKDAGRNTYRHWQAPA